MKNEQIVAVADAAKQWAVIQSIIGTHGLSKELEGIAILLLVRGHDQAEVLRAVEEIRNSTGGRDEALRQVHEAEKALHHAMNLLDMENETLYNSEGHLRELEGLQEPVEAELVEVVEEEFDDELAEAGPVRPRRY